MQVHRRLLRQVAGVVGEVLREQRHCHGVQLDGLDVGRVVIERGQNLVPAGRTDDQLACGGLGEDVERDRARVRGIGPERRRLAVEAPDPGAEGAVVRQQVTGGVRGELHDVDTEHRTPRRVLRYRRVELSVLGADVGQDVLRRDRDDEHNAGDRGEAEEQRPRCARRQPHHREDQGREHDDAGWFQARDQRDGQEAPETGADQIREVHAANTVAGPSQEHRDNDSERDERGKDRKTDRAQPKEVRE